MSICFHLYILKYPSQSCNSLGPGQCYIDSFDLPFFPIVDLSSLIATQFLQILFPSHYQQPLWDESSVAEKHMMIRKNSKSYPLSEKKSNNRESWEENKALSFLSLSLYELYSCEIFSLLSLNNFFYKQVTTK